MLKKATHLLIFLILVGSRGLLLLSLGVQMPIRLRRRSKERKMVPPSRDFDHADQVGLITGNRCPQERSIMDHFWLYRQGEQSARQIGLALNCQPPAVLDLLMKMRDAGQVVCAVAAHEITVDSPWRIAS